MYSQKDFDQFNISYIPVNNKLLAFDDCTPDAQVCTSLKIATVFELN